MGVEVGGIGEAVALNVWAAGIGGVGPPVVAFREVIVRAAEITTSARDQMARLDALVTETSDCVRIQIERIDMVVGDAVTRVQETTAAVQGTILKPVREVNGLISGVRAALSTLARGNRASVDHATQDEEMFI